MYCICIKRALKWNKRLPCSFRAHYSIHFISSARFWWNGSHTIRCHYFCWQLRHTTSIAAGWLLSIHNGTEKSCQKNCVFFRWKWTFRQFFCDASFESRVKKMKGSGIQVSHFHPRSPITGQRPIQIELKLDIVTTMSLC